MISGLPTTLRKTGNSQCVTIPPFVRELLDIDTGQKLVMDVNDKDKEIIIRVR